MKNPIFDIDNWREILATLSRNKTRTFLTAFGIFWGTAMLALLWGGAHGMEDMLRQNFAGFSTNTMGIYTQPTSMPYKGFRKGMQWSLKQSDLEKLRGNIPEIEASFGEYIVQTNAQYNRKKSATSLLGVEHGFSKILEPIIYEGRFLNESDDRMGRKVCVIGKRVANELFGNESPLGKFVKGDNLYYQVVGVAGQQSDITMGSRLDESITVPISVLRSAYNQGDRVDFIVMLMKRGVKPSQLQGKIRRLIATNHPISPDDQNAVGFIDISEAFGMIDNMFTGVNLLALFVGLGSLLAGIIGVGNIMWIIVKERTQEIGVRRAIGAKPRDIIVQVLCESMVLTVIAGVAGVCFAVLILGITTKMLSQGEFIPGFQLTFVEAVVILAAFLILGSAAGTLPALKAMNIKPIEALNSK